MAEKQQMKRLDQVQGGLSRVEAAETQVNELIGDGGGPIVASPATSWERKWSESYVQQVAALTSEGGFKVVHGGQ